MTYTVEVKESVAALDRQTWDSLFTDPLFSSDWFHVIETVRPIHVLPRYHVLSFDHQVVAALPAFLQHEEMYTTVEDRLFGRIRTLARRLGVRALPALLANSPLSYQGGIGLSDRADEAAAIGELLAAMEETARREGAPLYGFSYLSPGETVLSRILEERGFSRGLAVPMARLDIEWADFDEYLRHISRRHKSTAAGIRRQINRNRKAGVRLERVTDFEPHAEEFARLFHETYHRYTGRETPLKARFFRELSSRCSGKVTAYCGFKDGRLQGYFIVLRGAEIWNGLLTGQEYGQDDRDFTFFSVTFYEPIRDAIAKGAKRIYYGPACYDAKLRRGCRVEPLYMWLRSPSEGANHWLKWWLDLADRRYRRKYKDLLSLQDEE